MIYRESRTRIAKYLVGQFVGKVIEILESSECLCGLYSYLQLTYFPGATIDLKDKSGSGIASNININLSLVSEPEEGLIEIVIANAALLDSTIQAPAGMSVLGETLHLTKNIMDGVAGVCSYYFPSIYYCSDSSLMKIQTHPILKASWTVMLAVYKVNIS